MIEVSTAIKSQLEDSKLFSKPSVTINVDVSSSDMITTLADKLLAELNRMAPYSEFSPVSSLTSMDIERYLKTLVWMRVNRVVDATDESARSYRRLNKVVSVPVLMYQLLLCIGKAYDADYNLAFKPEYTITSEDLLSVEELESLSDVFRQFENSGMKVVYGIPSKPEGELDFMAMSHVEDEVVSYRRSHPVFGFFAAFFRQQKLNEVTGSMSRVVYGYESDYKYRIGTLVSTDLG